MPAVGFVMIDGDSSRPNRVQTTIATPVVRFEDMEVWAGSQHGDSEAADIPEEVFPRRSVD